MLIAGPNLTIDRTLEIDAIRPGEVLRFTRAHVRPGGKGVNVARAARALGFHAHLVGLVPGRTGSAVAQLIGDEELGFSGVEVRGEVRSAAIVMEAGGRVTVFNEPGPKMGPGEWDAYEERVTAELPRHRILVCIGSTPPGAPTDAYANLVARAHDASVAALVDAGGPSLGAALASRPDYVVPNLAEAEGLLLGRDAEKVDTVPREARAGAMDAAGKLAARGARTAIVTAGSAGVAVAAGPRNHVGGSGGEVRAWIGVPRVAVVNPIGAGDVFVAGFAGAIERGGDLLSSVEEAAAAAAASVEHPVPGGVEPARARDLLGELRIEKEGAPPRDD